MVGILAVASACKDDRSVSECPHYWSTAFHLAGGDTNVAPLSAGIRDVPEYHDCQRLMADERSYGPLAAVFASRNLPSLEADIAGAGGSAIAAATVLGIDQGFAPLGIGHGGNCLYMWKAPDGAWKARMVPVPDNGESCLDPINPAATTGTDLSVATEAASAPDSHPFVARFQYASGAHQIGLRCGSDWCTIGTTTSSAALTLPDDAGIDGWLSGLPGEVAAPVTLDQLRRLARMPGWGDAQFLAPAGGGNRPTALWALVLPSPKLDAMVEADFTTWRVTGFVWIPPSAPANVLTGYTQRFNYGMGWNALMLCEGTGCFTAGETPPTCTSTVAPDQRWYARIRSRTDDTEKTLCVVRREHGAPDGVPGTARWRWVKGDETVWEGCPRGCCEVQGGN